MKEEENEESSQVGKGWRKLKMKWEKIKKRKEYYFFSFFLFSHFILNVHLLCFFFIKQKKENKNINGTMKERMEKTEERR